MALFTTCSQHPDKFGNSSRQTNPHLFLTTDDSWVKAEPWLLSSFYPTLTFIQHVSSSMCDVSTSKIQQRQPRTHTIKNLFLHFCFWFVFLNHCWQIPHLAHLQFLFSVYSSETCFISWAIYSMIFLSKDLSR